MGKLTNKVPFQSTTTKVISSMAQEIKATLQPRTPAAMWGKPDEPKEKTRNNNELQQSRPILNNNQENGNNQQRE